MNKLNAGKVMLYTYLVRKLAKDSLNKKQRIMLQFDLKRLRSVQHSPRQKLRVMESMFRSYSFLHSEETMI
jgi:hypothetical protein